MRSPLTLVRSSVPAVVQESPAADIRNALQICNGIRPYDQSPAEQQKDLLALEARLYTALAKLEGRHVPISQADGDPA